MFQFMVSLLLISGEMQLLNTLRLEETCYFPGMAVAAMYSIAPVLQDFFSYVEMYHGPGLVMKQ